MRDKLMTLTVEELLDKMAFATIDSSRADFRVAYDASENLMMRALLMFIKTEERFHVQNNNRDIAGDRADEAGVNADLPF